MRKENWDTYVKNIGLVHLMIEIWKKKTINLKSTGKMIGLRNDQKVL